MVQVSQEQKRVIKKFAAVGYEYDTLTERNVWAIHYLLTHTNPGVADGERAPSPVALGRTYGEYWRGRNGGIGDGLKGMRDMWRNARRIVSSDAERARLDDSMRATVIDSIKGNDIMFRAHVERDYPTALIADMDIYDGWLYMDDERLAEWWSDDADRRIRDYAGRVSSVFLEAIRRCPDDDELACDGVVMLAALMYAHWHVTCACGASPWLSWPAYTRTNRASRNLKIEIINGIHTTNSGIGGQNYAPPARKQAFPRRSRSLFPHTRTAWHPTITCSDNTIRGYTDAKRRTWCTKSS